MARSSVLYLQGPDTTDWPGVHCIQYLLEGTPLTGHWFYRSQEHGAQVQGEG
jgi:hypothetical protein